MILENTSNSDFNLLTELQIQDYASFGLLQDLNKSILRYIDKVLIIINDHHIIAKNVNNSRFPDDPDIKKYVCPFSVKNYKDHIFYIVDKIMKINSKYSIRSIMDKIMDEQYKNKIIGHDSYDYSKDDIPFKFSIYSDFRYYDSNINHYRYFRLESALAVWGTFLTCDRYPLINITDWDITNTDNEENKYQYKIIKRIQSCINGYNSAHKDDPLFEIGTKENKYNSGKLNKNFFLRYKNYIVYINGYSTWVKEIEPISEKYKYNNSFNLATNKGHVDLGDMYKDIQIKGTNKLYTIPDIQTKCIPFNPDNPTIEIDDEFYNKLFNFELNRYKK